MGSLLEVASLDVASDEVASLDVASDEVASLDVASDEVASLDVASLNTLSTLLTSEDTALLASSANAAIHILLNIHKSVRMPMVFFNQTFMNENLPFSYSFFMIHNKRLYHKIMKKTTEKYCQSVNDQCFA